MIAILFPLLLAAVVPAKQAPAYFARYEACPSVEKPILEPCAGPIELTADAAVARLGEKQYVWSLDGDELTIIAQPGDDGWATLCCGLQTPLDPIAGTGLVGIEVRVPRIREAIFDIGTQATEAAEREVYRGPNAPSAPAVAEPLRGKIERYAIASRSLGETRRGSIYVPPDIPKSTRVPVIYLADGDTAHYAPILEAAIRDGRAPPAIIVGLEPGQGPLKGCTTPCDRRMLEYVIDLNPEGALAGNPFGRHLRFVTDELIPYVESRYPVSPRREDRVTAGYSNGGAWAIAAAEARPDLFGNVLAMSSVSKAVIALVNRLKDVQLYAGDGLLEGGNHRTPETAAAARAAGVDVRFRQLVAGHSPMLWDILFADGVAWLLPISVRAAPPTAAPGAPTAARTPSRR